MPEYGLRIKDMSGNATILTPQIANIVAAGSLTMSNALNGDNTYGTDISLPIADVPVGDIGVIIYPTKCYFQATVGLWYWSADGSFPVSWYAKPGITYYTKADNGVMTAFTPGTMFMDDANGWDGLCAVFPMAGWDYTDATTEVSAVRIWAAMAHIIYDQSAAAFKTVYSIGNKGVETVDYMIFLKNH